MRGRWRRFHAVHTPPHNLIQPGYALPRQTHQYLIARGDIQRPPAPYGTETHSLYPFVIQLHRLKRGDNRDLARSPNGKLNGFNLGKL
ncbi:hypothetical protein D3C81_1694070 [compost metagenome]